jgi:hypothetical protein
MPPALPPEQEAEAQRIFLALQQAAAGDLLALARLLASKGDRQLLGPTEFEVRDIAHRIGATALATALAGRKKGATTAPPAPARTAPKPPSSSAGGPSGS